MQGIFLGGAREVGRLAFVLETGGMRLLFDYGLAPSDPPSYPRPAPPVDAALLSHAHLDHAGMMPAITNEHQVPVYATGPTLDAAEVLCRDALKVHRLEGYAAPYPDFAVSAFMEAGRPIAWDDPFEILGCEVQGTNSGHIPGSTMFRLEAERSFVFTADLNTAASRLVTPAQPLGCDVLVMEGTYAGRQHRDRKAEEERLIDAVNETIEEDGTCIIPAFAVGRTQEVLLVLEAIQAPIFLDGMGGKVTELFLRHPSFLRDHRKLSRMLSKVQLVRSPSQRKRATERGHVIVTTSGMLDGGPVLTHLKRVHDDPRSSVLLTGYQVEGTNGERLVNDRAIDVDGRIVKVDTRVEKFDLSGHAGHDELVAFAEGCAPETIVIMHSDEPEPLLKDLETVARRVMAPGIGERFELP